MMNISKITEIMLAVCASAALMACGGGGGGGGANPSPQIPPASAATPLSASNYSAVATPTAAALFAASTVGDAFDNINSVSASASGTNSSDAQLNADPMQLSLLAINTLQSREQTQATRSASQACPGGGTLSGTANDADNSNTATTGDSVSLTANNCVLTVGQPAANGSFSMTFNSLTRNAGNVITSLSASISFSNFSIDGSTFNGAATVVGVPNGAATISYTNFSTVRRGSTIIYNFTNSSSALGQVTISGLITVNNNTYTLSTTTPIVYGAYRPQSGTLRIADANNNRIELTPNSNGAGSVDIRLFLAGSSTASSSTNVPWSAI
jgi:hypothetical protein